MTTAIELLRNPRLVADDLDHCFGSGQDACLQWDTAETNDALKLGLKLNDAAFSGNFILVNKDHIDKDTGLGITADPRLVVWSGDDPAAGGANEYVSLTHDRTGAVIYSGTGKLSIPLAAGFPVADLGVHIWRATAGAVAADVPNTMMVFETDASAYIQFLSPNGQGPLGLLFGDVGSRSQGIFAYTNGGDRFEISIANDLNVYWSNGILGFRKAYTISTTAGDLTFNPAGRVVLGAHDQEFGEISDPAAPAANSARFYAKDNGSGKTQLVVRFPTGAVQVLATEP